MANPNRGPLQQAAGNVGADPEDFESKAGPGTRFSLARPLGYGDDAPPPRWVNVAVWNEDLRRQTKERIRKGSRVYVEGTITQSTYNGKPQYSMYAVRIGLIDFFTKAPRTTQPAQDAVPARVEPQEELDW